MATLPLGRRAGQALAAALLLTVVLLSQRGLQIAAPAAGRCSLAPAAIAAAAAAAACRNGEAQSTAPAAAVGSALLGGLGRNSGADTGGSSSSSSSVACGRAAGGAGPPSAAHPATACNLAVEPSQWADSCLLLRDACVDQGSIILYGEEHRMTASSPGLAPYEIVPTADYRKYIFLHPGTNARDYRYGHSPIRVRPASSQEGAAYLAQPAFSYCTVPIIWYPMWLANLAHFFRDNAAKMYGVLRDTPWAEHAKLVLVTAEGHAAPGMNYDVLQPLSRQRVETWADFSARLPSQPAPSGSGYHPAAWAEPLGAAEDGPPLSYEGGPQRCFRSLFVCNDGINISSHGWPLHGLGKRLVEQYSSQAAQLEAAGAAAAGAGTGAAGAAGAAEKPRQQQLEQQPAAPAARLAAAQAAMQDAEAAALMAQPDGPPLPGNSSSGCREVLLRVVFLRRSSPDRQLLNAAELIRACNRWRHTGRDGRRRRAVCWEAEPTDLLSGIAAAQAADVFVGVHGANMANAWLMRPGSSMIELQPYGFDEAPAHLQYPLFNYEDSESQVLWWVVSICDPQAWAPGQAEAAAQADAAGQAVTWRLAKNRNLVVSWPALEVALRTAVDAGGDASAYRQRRWTQGRWWWWLGPGGAMQLAGKGRFTHMRCPPGMAGGSGSAAAAAAEPAAAH